MKKKLLSLTLLFAMIINIFPFGMIEHVYATGTETYTLTIITNDDNEVEYENQRYTTGSTFQIQEGERVMMFARAKTGWKFNNATSEEVTISENGSIGRYFTMPAKNVTVTFDFRQVYTVTYDANGGEGAPSAQEKMHGVDLRLSSKTPTRAEYNFKGWATSSTSTTVEYNPSSTYIANAEVTLFAVWEEQATGTYSVEFDANGGTGTHGAISNLSGDYTLPTNTSFTAPNGKRFVGWSLTKDGAIVNSITMNQNQKVYAIWENIPAHTLTIITNDGNKVEYNNQNYTTGSTIQILEGEEVRMFAQAIAGWHFVNATSSDVTIQDNGSIGRIFTMPTKDVTITFNFEHNQIHTVTFVTNVPGDTTPERVETVYEGQNVTAPTLTRDGYTLEGWYTESSLNNVFDLNTPIDGTITRLYAGWEINKYTIRYDANGGTGAPSSQEKTHGTDLTLSSTIPTRDNYEFLGWATTDNATTATYSAGANYTANEGTTLYAVWRENAPTTYTITVDSGTARVEGTEKYSAVAGETVVLNSSGAPTGKEFDKWELTGVTVSDLTQGEITFTMPANNVVARATYKDIVDTYDFIDNTDDQTFTVGNVDNYVIKIKASVKKFVSLKVDGVEYRENTDYEVTSGSTIITFLPAGITKLNNLAVGEYDVEIEFTDENLTAKLNLTEDNTSTGGNNNNQGNTEDNNTTGNENNNEGTTTPDNNNNNNNETNNVNNPKTFDGGIVMYIVIAILSILGLSGTVIMRKKGTRA